jgi:hypothetical protein
MQEKKYIYGRHVAPHDVAVRELGTGKSRRQTAKELGINFDTAPKLSVDDGINAVRGIFNRCWFDRIKCNRGLQALKNYKKDWDDKNMVYRKHPLHNWASHGADALRTFAVGFKKPVAPPDPSQVGGVKPYHEGLPG